MMKKPQNNTVLRTSYQYLEDYQKEIDASLTDFLKDFRRKELDQNLIVYEQESDTVVRLIFFDKHEMVIYFSYTLNPEFTNQWKDEELLRKNFKLLFGRFGREQEQIDISYAFSVQNTFSLDDLKYYMAHMEKTLENIMD